VAIRVRRSRVRILALETSSQRGTVVLSDGLSDGTAGGTRTVSVRVYDAHPSGGGHSAHAMRLVDEAFTEAGWERTSLDRVAAGVGPGSFTGLRVGISVAQGIALALGKPAVGVGSLRAMCRGVPASLPGLRCAFGDARRGELFAAAYGAAGEHVAGIDTIPRAELGAWVASVTGGAGVVLVGKVLGELAEQGALSGVDPAWILRSELTDEPHAACVAEVAASLDPGLAPCEPEYVREADAIRPTLPRHPLWSDEQQ
jgi:tRNA threonylcarbamoyladenosine biosynthesis protein TsaB